VLQEIGQIDKVELEVVLTGVVGFQQLSSVELSTENGKARVRWTLAQVLQRAGMGQDVAQTDPCSSGTAPTSSRPPTACPTSR